MDVDPNLDLLSRVTAERRRASLMGDLDRRVTTVENSYTVIQVGQGPPTSSPQDGTPYLDALNLRLYLTAGGSWHYVQLT